MPDHDPAAVGAAAKIRIYRATCAEEHYPMDDSEAARIITDAYRPRLTAEREVREKLVDAGNEVEEWLFDIYGCVDPHSGPPANNKAIDMALSDAPRLQMQMKSAIAEAKKLEDCR